MMRKRMKIWKKQLKNQKKSVWNNNNRQKGNKVKIKWKINFMKRKRNTKYKKKTHLTFNIMTIKKCSGPKYNRIYKLKNRIIRNSCLVFKIKIYKEIRYINMGKIHRDHLLKQVTSRILILVLILIIPKIKKVLGLPKKRSKLNLSKLKVTRCSKRT